MLEAFSDSERVFLTRIVGTKIIPTLMALAKGGVSYAFNQWNQMCEEQREVERAIATEAEVRRIMRESTRGNRTAQEKETLYKYISKLACIPSEVSSAAMETLCNEIDYFPQLGKSILFLQGDFGNVYYMIARGSVGLYLEKSKDREMQIGTEFGKWRGVPYTRPMEDLNGLGFNIVTLQEGQGFGEFAILSTSGKLRMCAAVAATDDTFIFVLHGDTYNAVLRQHHYRSKQLSQATALLQQLPIFNNYSYSKLSNIAYAMKSSAYATSAVLVKSGSKITNVLIVSSGQVKVIQPSVARGEPANADGVWNAQETLEMRLPKLAHAIMGRGSIIGQHEMMHDKDTFKNTYISCSADCEVFEMPSAVFKENCLTPEVLQTSTAQALVAALDARQVDYNARVQRTEESTKKFAMAHARSTDEKAQLLRLLPLLIDGINLDDEEPASARGDYNAGSFNKFSKETTAADIVKEATTGWFGGKTAYGYDPSVSKEDNLSVSDSMLNLGTVKTAATGGYSRTPLRPNARLRSAGGYGSTGKKMQGTMGSMHSHAMSPGNARTLAPSPRASRVIQASSLSNPNTPRRP